MATILCVSDGMTSVVYPALELSRRLALDGHRVVFASAARRRALAEDLGLDFLELAPGFLDDARRADRDRGLFRRLSNVAARRQELRKALGVDTFSRDLRRLAPDLVLLDGEMHEHIVVALGALEDLDGLRIALLNSFASIWRRPGMPPPHTLARPGKGLAGTRAAIALRWTGLRWRKRFRRLRQGLRHLGCDRESVLRVLASEYGVDLDTAVDRDQWLVPFTYRGLPVLSLHAVEFEFPHSPARQTRYVGPMILRNRVADGLSAEDRRRLDALWAERTGNAARPLVYASFGSTLTARPALLRNLVDACAHRGDGDDVDLVLSLGRRLQPDALGPLPEGVHVFPWVPQLEVLAHARAVVTHGGINTLDECVLHGVPVLVYCGHETDMAGNTARVVHHGIGIAGDPRDGSVAIRRRIRTLLTDRTYRTRVALLRHRYEAYDRSDTLEATVEGLLTGRLSGPLKLPDRS